MPAYFLGENWRAIRDTSRITSIILGLGSSKDWQLMAVVREQDYTFVANNRADFLSLHGRDLYMRE
jgi:hypothetical protein